MDPSSPPDATPGLVLAAVPALFAALFATASAAVASVPDSRKVALRSALNGRARAALERYLAAASTFETRWLVLRMLGIALSAILFVRALGAHSLASYALAILAVLFVYGIPAELGIVFARRMPADRVPRILQVLRPFDLLAAPLAGPLILVGRVVSRSLHRKRPPSASLAESEVEILVNEGELNGSLAHDQSEMIRNVLDFGDIRAGDVMVPRTHVTALDVEMPPENALKLVAEKVHSRYPVYRERIDNVVGILHVKDLINFAASHDLKKLQISEIMRTPVVFVPESQSASSVLMDMRAGRRHHMAIIIDEFGGISGIVTLEDLIEEIVGDIRDEHDTEEPPIVDLGNGRLMIDAGVPIGDLSRYLGIELPEDGDYNSVGGFIVERMGQVPEVGATITDFGLEFIVREADERHVAKVEIVRLDAASPDSLPAQSSRQPAA